MKLADEDNLKQAKSVAVRGFVNAGDQITTGATHEILINGDKSWIKFEATTTVGEKETPAGATERIIRYVNDAVMDAVRAAVDTVNEAQL